MANPGGSRIGIGSRYHLDDPVKETGRMHCSRLNLEHTRRPLLFTYTTHSPLSRTLVAFESNWLEKKEAGGYQEAKDDYIIAP